MPDPMTDDKVWLEMRDEENVRLREALERIADPDPSWAIPDVRMIAQEALDV